METHFEILIDASGSMGLMKGDKENSLYLLPDGKSTRTDLVKKILNESIIPKLKFANSIGIYTFKNHLKINSRGEYLYKRAYVKDGQGKIVRQKIHDSIPLKQPLYKGGNNSSNIKEQVDNLSNPEPAGTPIYYALSETIKKCNGGTSIIILSDGDANDKINFDEEIISDLKKSKKDITIFFIGIAQDEAAQKKSQKLAEFTGGKYVNVKAINYEKELFDNFLFAITASITEKEIKRIVQPVHPENEQVSNEQENNSGNIQSDSDKEEVKETQEKVSDKSIEQRIDKNTKSIDLVRIQLESITQQINFLTTSVSEHDFLDVDKNQVQNIETGKRCEAYLYEKFKKNNWTNLNWVNEKHEKYLPYDFTVEQKGECIYIECKGSASDSLEFVLTAKEWNFYLEKRPNYRLYFVGNIQKEKPEVHRFEDLLKSLEQKELFPFSQTKRKVREERTWFQINKER